MSKHLHQIVGYGIGAVGFFTLGLATERKAETLPYVSQIHALPAPAKTYIFDQRTQGGHSDNRNERCAVHTRILVRSAQDIKTLQNHYSSHPVREANGTGFVRGKVRPAFKVEDLAQEWKRHQSDPDVFVVDFDSPGAVCSL